MSSNDGYSVTAPPRRGGDRFSKPPIVRRQPNVPLKQRQQEEMATHEQNQKQRQPQWTKKSTTTATAEKENRKNVERSSRAEKVTVPPPVVAPASSVKLTNLQRFIESVTPYIPRQCLSEVNAWGKKKKVVPFFLLEDLWESFREWSAYGAGVPLVLNGKDPIEQYYVPFLSGLQLHFDPSKPQWLKLASSAGNIDPGDDKPVTSSSGSEAKIVDSHGGPIFQFLEYEQPYNRRPLADKIAVLTSQYPDLGKCRSCDLLPASWICVAWYPIYRIPIGPNLKELDASFLTFHNLSTRCRGISRPRLHAANTRKVHGIVDPTAKISLPVFGLASYKLKGSMISPSAPQECEQENFLMQAAEDWLNHLQVSLPDYQFFRAHSGVKFGPGK